MQWSRMLIRTSLLLLAPTVLLTSSADAFLTAKAIISGGPNGISGQALFVQDGAGNVIVTLTVKGPPNVLLQGRHGVHIHEVGACDAPGFTTAGGHFDPGPNGNSNTITNHPYHLGDLQNLQVNAKGEGAFVDVTTRVSLTAGDISVFDDDGSAIIIHQLEDQQSCQAAAPGGPCTGVSGGPRLACGVIKLVD
jgi:superoxide dismutase, Cu-Zn family